MSSGMLRRVALVRTDVSEERGASFIRLKRISELGTMVTVTSDRLVHRFLSPCWRRHYFPPKRRFLQEPYGVTSQKTPFFIATAVKTSNLINVISVVTLCRKLQLLPSQRIFCQKGRNEMLHLHPRLNGSFASKGPLWLPLQHPCLCEIDPSFSNLFTSLILMSIPSIRELWFSKTKDFQISYLEYVKNNRFYWTPLSPHPAPYVIRKICIAFSFSWLLFIIYLIFLQTVQFYTWGKKIFFVGATVILKDEIVPAEIYNALNIY
jgi:hypothetical protein